MSPTFQNDSKMWKLNNSVYKINKTACQFFLRVKQAL